jgi:D-alanyl-lipoteichoic acid acyltransferase DltB (MBOAT superfamily)
LLFNSYSFLLFFLIVISVFLLIKDRFKAPLLLSASLYFYGVWNWKILILLILTVWINHLLALRISRLDYNISENDRLLLKLKRQQRILLIAGISLNISFLIFFKYFTFFLKETNHVFNFLNFDYSLPVPEILLPVGISFYTFQITAYLIDVYKNRITAEKSFFKLLLFTVYFPQLVAGPIERAEFLLPRLSFIAPDPEESESPEISIKPKFQVPLNTIFSGAFLFSLGLFKKIYIADNLAPYVDLHLIPGIPAPSYGYTFPAIIFALQIYADFSGYTDMARGLSRTFGAELSENFRLPFLASNPSELWRRWHITLMSFLRDYIYVPLGGGKTGKSNEIRNTLIVFFIGGLWHGASVGHIVWGIYSGILVVGYRLIKPIIKFTASQSGSGTVLKVSGIIFTFLTFSWGALLIRIPTYSQFSHIYSNLFPADYISYIPKLWPALLFYSWPLFLFDYIQQKNKGKEIYTILSPGFRIIWLISGFLLFIFFGFRGSREFIYFQF